MGAGIGGAFAASFQKEYGRASTRHAALGYDTARLIGSAVRALGGELADREAQLPIATAPDKSLHPTRKTMKFGKNYPVSHRTCRME